MFSTAFTQAARMSTRRTFSSNVSTTFLTKNKAATSSESFKQAWLSDPSTYPILVIMSAAACMCIGVGTSCLMYNPDVQINPNKRGAIMRQT